MSRINERCAGIDVGKRFLLCCVLTGAAQDEPRGQTRRFDATVKALVRMREWLTAENVTHVVMESTGSYWIPVFNILEGEFVVVLANPEEVKTRKGHKTDRKDAEHLADLLRHNHVRSSYIPNLNSGGGSALALAGLGTGMAVMAKQKGLDGITVLNVQPRHLAVPVALQLTAFQLVAANLAPAQSANVVPDYIRALTPIAEPRLDAASATAWYLLASPDQIDTIEYAYLEGQDGVYIETRQGFDVDGVEIKARLDFGAKAIDWRGMQKNSGA